MLAASATWQKLPASADAMHFRSKAHAMNAETQRLQALRDLETRREFWQTIDPYDPVRRLDSWETRYEQGKALREQTPHESQAT